VAFIDAIVLVTFMYGTSDIFGLFEQVPDVVRAIAAIFIFLLYDPLFTGVYGGTIGHSFSGIEVNNKIISTKTFPLGQPLPGFYASSF